MRLPDDVKTTLKCKKCGCKTEAKLKDIETMGSIDCHDCHKDIDVSGLADPISEARKAFTELAATVEVLRAELAKLQ